MKGNKIFGHASKIRISSILLAIVYVFVYVYVYKMKFRAPSEIRVEKEKRVTLSARVNESLKRKLEVAAKKTPQKLPVATLVEQVLEDYIKHMEGKGVI